MLQAAIRGQAKTCMLILLEEQPVLWCVGHVGDAVWMGGEELPTMAPESDVAGQAGQAGQPTGQAGRSWGLRTALDAG